MGEGVSRGRRYESWEKVLLAGEGMSRGRRYESWEKV